MNLKGVSTGQHLDCLVSSSGWRWMLGVLGLLCVLRREIMSSLGQFPSWPTREEG